MVVVVGSTNVDVVAELPRAPRTGETLLADQGWLAPGGKGANQAVAAARQGAAVRFLSAVGDDALAKVALSVLRTLGVDLKVPHVAGIPTGMALIWLAHSGSNTIVVVPGANGTVTPDRIWAQPKPGPGDVVLVSLEVPLATAVAAADWARAGGAALLVDPAPAPDALPASLWQADILMPNRGEAEQLLGGAIPPGEEVAAARALAARGAKLGVVKLGADGLAWAKSTGDSGRVPALRVAAVDTTGAGDAFAGALAAELAAGQEEVEEALNRASWVAAVACTRVGAQTGVPTWSEVLAYVDAHADRPAGET